MEIWLDTIDRSAIEYAKNLGLLHGITTNPAIFSEAKEPAEVVLEDLLNRYLGPLAVQVTLSTASEMIEQGKDLYDFSSRIIVKVPVTKEGIEAIYRLSHIEIPVMATTIFEPIQALLAIKAGARYLEVYLSHLEDKGLPTCLSIQRILTNKTKLLVAALNTPFQVAQCAELGFSAVTLKVALFNECLIPPSQTMEYVARFESAWKQAPLSNLLSAPQFIK